MNFSEALDAMKKGHAVQRSGWNGPGQWVSIMDGATTHCIELAPFLVIRTVQDIHIPWLASQGDLLANDWVIGKQSP